MDILEEINKRFKDGVTCPYCKSKKIQKYGFYNEDQKYKCKECCRSFTKYTKTLLHWSHYKEKWGDFIISMGKEETLRESGEELDVNYSTLHFWRHKILAILNEDNENEINGEVEIIKKVLPYVNKNRKDKDYSKDRNLEKDVNLVLLYNKSGKISSFVYGEYMQPMDFLKEIIPIINKDTLFYLPNNKPFRYPMIGLKLKFKDTLKPSPEGCSLCDFSVNKYILEFCHWKFKFKGISSKYLSKYVSYYSSLKIFKNMKEKIFESFGNLCQIGGFVPTLGHVLY